MCVVLVLSHTCTYDKAEIINFDTHTISDDNSKILTLLVTTTVRVPELDSPHPSVAVKLFVNVCELSCPLLYTSTV